VRARDHAPDTPLLDQVSLGFNGHAMSIEQKSRPLMACTRPMTGGQRPVESAPDKVQARRAEWAAFLCAFLTMMAPIT
jgi:hypothetical protein